jgi:hypothetical protein
MCLLVPLQNTHRQTTAYLRKLPDTDIGVSPFSSTADIEAAYIRIQEEIGWLEAAIRASKLTEYKTSSRDTLNRLQIRCGRFLMPHGFQMGQSNIHIQSLATCSAGMSQSVDYHSPFTPAEEILERSKSASLNIVAVIPDRTSRSLVEFSCSRQSWLGCPGSSVCLSITIKVVVNQ